MKRREKWVQKWVQKRIEAREYRRKISFGSYVSLVRKEQ
jgi:hypothetical protein